MAISAKVPPKLSRIKNKVIFNLTKRQLLCFGAAALFSFPAYFSFRNVIGQDLAVILMVILMLPFFFFAIYEKNGFPAEKVLLIMYRQKRGRPGVRVYQSENIYSRLWDEEASEQDAYTTKEERKSEAGLRVSEEKAGEYKVKNGQRLHEIRRKRKPVTEKGDEYGRKEGRDNEKKQGGA